MAKTPSRSIPAGGTRRWSSSLHHGNRDTKHHDPGAGSLSVETLAGGLARSDFQNIVALVGAGASCSAGIPDFRTPGTGLYDRLGKHDLPVPEAIFDLGYYTRVTPAPFVEVCRSIWPGQEGGPLPTLPGEKPTPFPVHFDDLHNFRNPSTST